MNELDTITAACNVGIPMGIYHMALVYIQGLYNQPVDIRKGLKLMLEAAEKGYPDAQYEIGVLALQQKDYTTGLKMLEQSALNKEKGELGKGAARSAYTLALIYVTGQYGVMKSDKDALRFMEMAANANFEDAASRVADAYIRGKLGATKSYEKAIKWLEIAAEKPDVNGLNAFKTVTSYYCDNYDKMKSRADEWFDKPKSTIERWVLQGRIQETKGNSLKGLFSSRKSRPFWDMAAQSYHAVYSGEAFACIACMIMDGKIEGKEKDVLTCLESAEFFKYPGAAKMKEAYINHRIEKKEFKRFLIENFIIDPLQEKLGVSDEQLGGYIVDLFTDD